MAVKSVGKLCLNCGRTLGLDQFYPNKGNKEHIEKDCWCKDCVSKEVYDQDTLIRYCSSNRRAYTHEFWQKCQTAAKYRLASKPQFVAATNAVRKKMLTAWTCKQFIKRMNTKQFYAYVNDDGTSDLVQTDEGQVMQYSPTWRGKYTPTQIATLDAMYEQYSRDYDLSTVNRRQYARKVIKASLNSDIAQDKMRRGEISVSEYVSSQKAFDDLSKSSAFAQCARKAGTNTSLTSLGNIILQLQINHQLDINPFEFPQDDIDKVMADYRHLCTAVGAQL